MEDKLTGGEQVSEQVDLKGVIRTFLRDKHLHSSVIQMTCLNFQIIFRSYATGY